MLTTIKLAFIGHFDPTELNRQFGVEATSYSSLGDSFAHNRFKEFHYNRDKCTWMPHVALWAFDLQEMFGITDATTGISKCIDLFYRNRSFIRKLIERQKYFLSYTDYYNSFDDLKNPCAFNSAAGMLTIDVIGDGKNKLQLEAIQLKQLSELCNTVSFLYQCNSPLVKEHIEVERDDEVRISIENIPGCNRNDIVQGNYGGVMHTSDDNKYIEDDYLKSVLNALESSPRNMHIDKDCARVLDVAMSLNLNGGISVASETVFAICNYVDTWKIYYTCTAFRHGHRE